MLPDSTYSATDIYEFIPGEFWTFLPRVANPPFRPGARVGKKGAEGSLSASLLVLSKNAIMDKLLLLIIS
jgi:hypothetical protein